MKVPPTMQDLINALKADLPGPKDWLYDKPTYSPKAIAKWIDEVSKEL